MSQPGFDQTQSYQQPGYHIQQNNSAEFMRGTKFKEKSLIFGIIGFFFLGIVFGPLAIVNAKRAEELHHSATFGKVLGWIDAIFGAIGILVLLFVVVGGAMVGGGN